MFLHKQCIPAYEATLANYCPLGYVRCLNEPFRAKIQYSEMRLEKL